MSWYNTILKKLLELDMPRILRQECGSIIVFTAVAITTLLGLAGLAYDVGNLYMHKARLQNVADAAAYAGARAYVESQAKPQNDRDKLDDFVDIYTSAKPAEDFSINDNPKSKNRTGSKHPDADTAADDYIYKNIVNLGTTISTDGYSHYALLSKEDNPKTFYRIGLYEYVDLHFLPIIRGIGKKRRVGVESIAVLLEETGAPIPATIFSNLASYAGELSVEGTVSDTTTEKMNAKPGEGGSTIQTSFDGEIIHTGNKDDYFNPEDSVQNLYTSKAKEAQAVQNLSVNEINNTANDTDSKYINNSKKSSIIVNDAALADYMDILKTKMQLPSIELNMANPDDAEKFTVANINNTESNLYKLDEIDKEGNKLYSIKYYDYFKAWRYFTFSIDPNETDTDRKFYSYDIDGITKMYLLQITSGGNLIRVPSYLEELGFVPFTISGRQYNGNYVKDSNGEKTYYYIDTANNKVYFATKSGNKYSEVKNDTIQTVFLKHTNENKPAQNSQHIKYKKNNKDIIINFISFEESLFADDQLNQRILEYNTNIFHLVNSETAPITNLTLTFNDEVKGRGNKSEPIYIFDDTNAETVVNVTANNVRPIVIVHSGTSEIKINISEESTFDGVLFAPETTGTIYLNNNSCFMGNIVTRNVHVSNSGESSSFVQKNYMETDTKLYDSIIEYAVNKEQLFGDTSASESGYYDKPPTNTYTASWENWYSMVGEAKAAQWFDSLTTSQKNSFWKSWDFVTRPQNADNVFDDYIAGLREQWYDKNGWKQKWFFNPWTPREDVYNQEKEATYYVRDGVFDTQVRLINPRLELNPFTSL